VYRVYSTARVSQGTIIITIINNNKQKRLGTDIQPMWNLIYMIIPVIIGVIAIATKSFRKNFEALPGQHSIDSL
jgi:hypothetical protein